jgi:hypothetical protein
MVVAPAPETKILKEDAPLQPDLSLIYEYFKVRAALNMDENRAKRSRVVFPRHRVQKELDQTTVTSWTMIKRV